jgi:polysaccharide biosynthesis transport protein
MTRYDISLRNSLRILRRHKEIVILVPLLFGVSAFILTLLQTPRTLYQATASVNVEQVNSPTGLLHEVITLSPVEIVETQAALIKGSPVMGRAAKKLGSIPGEATPEEIRVSPVFLKAIQDLQKQVEVKVKDSTNLIAIIATSIDSKEAARIANVVTEAFQQENFAIRTRQVREAKEFIEKQLDEETRRLQMSKEKLRAFRDVNKIDLSRLSALEVDQTGVRRAMGEMEVRLRLLEEGKPLDHPITLFTDVVDAVLAKLYTSLFDRVSEREYLLLTLPSAHPQVKQADAQIATVRQSLRDNLQSKLQALIERADGLQETIARLKEEQAAIPKAALDMTRMEREMKGSERLFSLLKGKYQEALIKEKEQVGGVRLVSPAMVPSQPINPPQTVPKAAVWLVIGGLVMGVIMAFVREGLDSSIVAIDEVESLLETSVLGIIPHLDVKAELAKQKGEPVALEEEAEEKYAFLVSLFLPTSQVSEAFRDLRTNLLVSCLKRGLKTIMVTSFTQMEGKTTVAINVAIALAQMGKKTLLIEANPQNPFLHHAFGIQKEPGFHEVLTGSTRIEEATQGFPDLLLGKAGIEVLIGQPGIDYLDNLFLLPSGHSLPNPAGFLNAQRVADFLAEIRQHYDYVIIDSPPLSSSTDSAMLGTCVDGTLLVLQAHNLARASLRRTKAILEATKARVLGVCLTGVRAEAIPDYAERASFQHRHGIRERR